MKNPFVRFFGFVAIGICAIWILGAMIRKTIHDEAEATRDAMRDASGNLIRDNLETLVRDGTETTADAMDAMQNVLREGVDAAKQHSKADKSNLEANQKPRNSTSLMGDLFRAGQVLSSEVDGAVQEIAKLKPADRARMGQRVHAAISNRQTILSDPKSSAKLRSLAQPFLERQNSESNSIRFFVVDSPDINAFAHVGGYIYVHRGLLEFVESDEELAFVLGHEIGHVHLGHCARASTVAFRAEEIAGEIGFSVAQMAYQAIAVGYSEQMEFDADQWAYETAGLSKDAAIRFLKRLERAQLSPERSKPSNVVDAAVQQLEDHFATHPRTRDRIEALH